MEEVTPAPLRLFYAYAREDQLLRQQLNIHLTNVLNHYNIEPWSDREIAPGEDWAQAIERNLTTADIILLLISADFIASHYCANIEMEHALRRHKNGTALVIPIILRPCDWEHPPLKKLQALPNNGFPVVNSSRVPSKDDQFLNIAEGLRRAIPKKEARRQAYEKRKRDLRIVAVIGLIVLLLGFLAGGIFYFQNAQTTSHYHPVHPSSSLNLANISPMQAPHFPNITIGISNGQDVTFDGTNNSAERLIDEDNQNIQGPFFTVIAVTTLSDHDQGQSREIGEEELQGLYLWRKLHPMQIPVKILVANIGTKEPTVLQNSVDPVRDQIIRFANQNTNFMGVVGFSFSQSISDAMDLLASNNIPVVSPAASSSGFSNKWSYFHRVIPDNKTEGQDAANYAINYLHTKIAYVFVDSTTRQLSSDIGNPYSQTLGQAFSDTFAASNGSSSVYDEEYTVGNASTMNARMSDMISHNIFTDTTTPIAIFCSCYANDMSALHRALSQEAVALGIPLPKNQDLPSNIFLIGGEAAYELGSYDSSKQQLGSNQQQNSSNYKNMYFTAFAFPDTANILCTDKKVCSSEQMNFYAKYCYYFDPTEYGDGQKSCPYSQGHYLVSRPGPHTIQSYDAMNALLLAYSQAQKQESNLSLFLFGVPREAIQNAFAQVSFEGISGHIAFSNPQTPSDPVHKAVLILCANSQGLSHLLYVYGDFLPHSDSKKVFPNPGTCPD